MERLEPLSFAEAIRWARERKVVMPEVYYGHLIGQSRAAAATISGLASREQIRVVLDSMAESMQGGETFADWRKRVRAGDIALELPDHRLDNIWRTNIQGHYNRGRCEQQARNRDRRPYLMYDAVNDSRTRPAHAAMDGFVAPADDPVWEKWHPTNGYRCRCRAIALTEAQARRFEQADTNRRADNPDLDRARGTALGSGPDEGWDYSPCGDGVFQGLDKALAAAAKRGPTPKLPADLWSGFTPAAKRWHTLGFSGAPTWMIQRIRSIEPPRAVTRGADVAHHRAGLIDMDKEPENLRGAAAWRHEYGHYMDYRLATIPGKPMASSGQAFEAAMNRDAKRLRKTDKAARAGRYDDYYAQADRILDLPDDEREAFAATLWEEAGFQWPEVREAINTYAPLGQRTGDRYWRSIALAGRAAKLGDARSLLGLLDSGRPSEAGSKGMLPMASDLIGSLTRNAVVGSHGHRDAYYAGAPYRRGTETFANLTAMMGEGDRFWVRLAQRLAPASTREYLLIMKGK